MSAMYLAASFALSWLAGFSQASVLLAYLVVLLVVFLRVEDLRSPVRPPWSRTAWVAAGLAAGGLIAAVQILPALEAAGYSSRTPGNWEQMRAQAMPFASLLDFVLPGQMAAPGDVCPGSPENWRPTFLALWLTPLSQYKELNHAVFNHTETAIGLGVWPLLFAFATIPMLFRRCDEGSSRSVIGFLWTVALAGILMATAFPGLSRVLVLLPGMAVGDLKRLLMLPAIALPCLAAIGWREIRANDVLRMTVPAGLVAAAGVSLLAMSDEGFTHLAGSWIAPGYGYSASAFAAAVLPGEAALNRHLLSQGLLVLAAVIALPSVLLRIRVLAPWVFVIVTVIELVPVAWQVSPSPSLDGLSLELPLTVPEVAHRPVRILRVEHNDPKGRLLPLNLPLVWGLAAATGYAPIPSARTEAFFRVIEPGAAAGGTGVRSLSQAASAESPLVRLLSADVLMTDLSQPLAGWRRYSAHPGDFVPDGGPKFARLFTQFQILDTEAVPDAMKEPDFAPERTVLLEASPGFDTRAGDAPGEVELVSFAPGRLQFRCKTRGRAVLLVSQAWAPGWSYEWSEGSRGEVAPGDLMFQAVPVPAGDNEVTLTYDPPSFRIGVILALLGLAVLGACGWWAFRTRA